MKLNGTCVITLLLLSALSGCGQAADDSSPKNVVNLAFQAALIQDSPRLRMVLVGEAREKNADRKFLEALKARYQSIPMASGSAALESRTIRTGPSNYLRAYSTHGRSTFSEVTVKGLSLKGAAVEAKAFVECTEYSYDANLLHWFPMCRIYRFEFLN